MLTFLGFPLGGVLALLVVGSIEGVVSGALGGALAGTVIRAAQWLVLRRYMRVGPEWVGATALGELSRYTNLVTNPATHRGNWLGRNWLVVRSSPVRGLAERHARFRIFMRHHNI